MDGQSSQMTPLAALPLLNVWLGMSAEALQTGCVQQMDCGVEQNRYAHVSNDMARSSGGAVLPPLQLAGVTVCL